MAAEFKNQVQPNFIPGDETSDDATNVEEVMHKQHKFYVKKCHKITLDFLEISSICLKGLSNINNDAIYGSYHEQRVHLEFS